MRKLGRGLFIVALMTSTQVAAQDAALFTPSSMIINYDPFSGIAGLEDLTVEVQHTGLTPLSARLVITPDVVSNFELEGAEEPLAFEIFSANANSNQFQFDMPVTLASSGGPQPINLTLKIPSGQYADAGDLSVDLKFVLLDSATSQVISNEKILHIIGRTPLRAQTNFAGTSSGFENGSSYAVVDFGEITGGDSRTVNFQIRGNSDVDIEMSSENEGKLVNTETPEISPIPYHVNADGVESDLSAAMTFSRRPDKTLNGTSYPLTITLDDLQIRAFAGQYRDVISIDVTPR